MVNWYSNVFPGILGRTCDRPCEPACRRGRVEEEPVAICRLKRVAADYKGDITPPPAPPRRAHQRQANRPGRRRPRLADGRARPRAARLRAGAVRFRPARRRHDPQPDPEVPPPRGDHRRGGGLHHRPRHGDAARPAHRQPEGAAGGRLRRDLRRLRRAARARPADPGPARGRRQHPYRHRLAVLGVVRPHRQDRQARDRAGRRQHRDGLLPVLAPAGRRGRQGHRAVRLRGDEGVALGEGRRHARGHPDPQHAGAEGVHPQGRQADRRDVREGEGRARRARAAAGWCRPASRISTSSATMCWWRWARRTPSPGSSATSASSSTSGTCRSSMK